jgi:hypothetical protein
MGQHVGVRILDVLVVRERGFKRETKLLQILIFVKATLWKVGQPFYILYECLHFCQRAIFGVIESTLHVTVLLLEVSFFSGVYKNRISSCNCVC